MADDRFGELEMPAGTKVIISPWLMHRHRLYWSQPDVFDPENFAPERVAARRRYIYLPFGAGPRICIGQGFAMIERSEEHTSELQSLMRISYAVFCLKTKNIHILSYLLFYPLFFSYSF